MKILSPIQEALLEDEKTLLLDLRETLLRHEIALVDRDTLDRSLRQLDELFLVVVVGEFNAGKSSLVNALLGVRALPEGVTPTTTTIQIVRFGDEVKQTVGRGGVVEITAPAELLRQLCIVDTPGTNALDRQHEAITAEFVPRADLVLVVTSADRPFTESERQFLQRVREWGKKLVFVVNKIDILRREEERSEVVAFVREHARALIGVEPEVFPVAARSALEARESDDEAAFVWSRFGALERFLLETLDEKERIRLKLGNPLGVATKLIGTYLEAIEGRLELLREDLETLEDLERQLAAYREDVGREFRFRLADVENVLHAFHQRGVAFFDDTVRLARAIDLLNKARIKAEFEQKVVSDLSREVDVKVQAIIDWLVSSELRLWQGVTDRLAARRAVHAERIVGQVGSFDLDRARLLDTVGRSAQRTVERFDHEHESSRVADAVQSAIASTAIIEVGAVGLGTIVTMMATTQLVDVTGLFAAGTIALLGLFVLPARRREAKKRLAEETAELREQLLGSLTAEFDREVERGLERIREAVSPYTRFVRAERDHLGTARDELIDLRDRVRSLTARVEGI